VVVGARPGGRGVVSAASYEARRFGIHSAMPISRAYRLCPDAVYLPVAMDKYAGVSREIMSLLAQWTPLLEPVSIDEAFLDVTESRALRGDGPRIARDIKARIRAEMSLSASVGVAPNKFLAKVASDLEKPDGLVVVPPGGEEAFLAPLPIGRLWGGAPKSMGAEETFDVDHREVDRLRATLRAQAERVARELRSEGYAGRVVTLKIRFADFSTYTRAHTGEPTQDGLRIFEEAAALLGRVRLTQAVRLIGLSVSGLGPAGQGQLPLFGPDLARRERLGRALDQLTQRYGEDTVRPASLLGRRRRRSRPVEGEDG